MLIQWTNFALEILQNSTILEHSIEQNYSNCICHIYQKIDEISLFQGCFYCLQINKSSKYVKLAGYSNYSNISLTTIRYSTTNYSYSNRKPQSYWGLEESWYTQHGAHPEEAGGHIGGQRRAGIPNTEHALKRLGVILGVGGELVYPKRSTP